MFLQSEQVGGQVGRGFQVADHRRHRHHGSRQATGMFLILISRDLFPKLRCCIHIRITDSKLLQFLQESYEQKSAGFEIRGGDGRAMLEEMAAKIEGVFKKNEASLRVSDITTRNVQFYGVGLKSGHQVW